MNRRRGTPDSPPDKFRTFYELPAFVRRWDALGLSESDRLSLMNELMADPERGSLVRGAKGLRKLRFAPAGVGKSGAYRVYYARLPDFGVVVLAIVFAKNEASDIPPSMRSALVDAVRGVEAALQARRDKAMDSHEEE